MLFQLLAQDHKLPSPSKAERERAQARLQYVIEQKTTAFSGMYAKREMGCRLEVFTYSLYTLTIGENWTLISEEGFYFLRETLVPTQHALLTLSPCPHSSLSQSANAC